MAKAPDLAISARKVPRQARSVRLVADVLEAAARVLAREGARRFTTVRVAEEAGVSIGSLYQYFPSKEALLFRLQTDEWTETWTVLEEMLDDRRSPPLVRLRAVIRAFFRSERQEAALRVALDDAGALFRDAPEARAFAARTAAGLDRFFAEALPTASPAERKRRAEVVMTTLSAVAEKITARGLSQKEVDVWAESIADLCCGYLETANARAPRRRTERSRR